MPVFLIFLNFHSKNWPDKPRWKLVFRVYPYQVYEDLRNQLNGTFNEQTALEDAERKAQRCEFKKILKSQKKVFSFLTSLSSLRELTHASKPVELQVVTVKYSN